MINLHRTKAERWILQKNISSSDLIESFVTAMKEQGNEIDSISLKTNLKLKNLYTGRSASGNANTMGVRMSQMCFYMFGYKKESLFIPSPMTQLLLNKSVPVAESTLVNLFSMQFPNPYSETISSFKIYFGRLIVKLLLDKRIENKLYIDEAIWFLPFIKTINNSKYDELVVSILEYRKLSYGDKLGLFKSVHNYEDVFANCMHEFNYYFFRIFSGFGVIDIIEDSKHNGGKLFKFKHGNTETYRTDAYKSRSSHSGYIALNNSIVEKAKMLSHAFNFTDAPILQSDSAFTKSEWIRELYEFEPLKYINLSSREFKRSEEITGTIKQMVYTSKFGSKDGKDFERSLKNTFELFREIRDCEIISGSGDTDILCKVLNENESVPYKINVDAKSTGKSTQAINAKRIMLHVTINGSKYCIIVSPRFASGVKLDIKGEKIVTITAEVLANYFVKECLASDDGYANFTVIDKLIETNYGSDISEKVDTIINNKYAM